jgi:DNA-binding IclR family transcriptional regulator
MPAGALERAVELLGRLEGGTAEQTVAELASSAGMPTSTAYRLLSELEQHGLIQRGPDRTVTLGARLVALGRTAEAGLHARLTEPAAPVMDELARTVGETVILTVPCGSEAIVLDVVETERHPVRLTYPRYMRAPMHLGASGKVLAAHLDPLDRERLLAVVGQAGLDGDLDQIRRRGYAVTTEELDIGATAVAAPILDRRGRIVGGLSIAGPSERIAPRLETVTLAALGAAQTVERRIAARDSDNGSVSRR